MTAWRRHSRAPAGLAAVIAAICLAAVCWLLGRWPDTLTRATIGAVIAAGLVVAAWAGVRAAVRSRETRTSLDAVVLAAAVTVAVSATLFAATVLVLVGRPSNEAVVEMRAALIAAVVMGVALARFARRVGGWAQRTVHGSRGPRRRMLDEFGQRLARAETLDAILQRLVETVVVACSADAAEIWLTEPGRLVLRHGEPQRPAQPIAIDDTRAGVVARAGVSGDGWTEIWLPELRRQHDHLRVAPLGVQGDLLGLLVVRRDALAGDFDDSDDEGLARVARLVAAAIHADALDAELRRTVEELRRRNAELQRSRARLVTVASDERRRLERDLHDGAQSQLMAIAVKVQLAAAMCADGAPARPVLAEIEHDLAVANTQLRDLAHGIFPPLLLTGGLADALAGIAARSPAAVTLAHVTRARYDPRVEAAVYFCCLEAVHNAAKHAGPSAAVTIDVHHDSGLTFVVHDDGTGFDTATANAGQGFTNMSDRLGALGGALQVHSTPGAGTTVRGTIPADALTSAVIEAPPSGTRAPPSPAD